MALKSVDFPTFGSPTIPALSMKCGRYRARRRTAISAHVGRQAFRPVRPADMLSAEGCGVSAGVKLRLGQRLTFCMPGQSRLSGRRDLNPRPVAAATVLQIQHGKFVAASPRLEIALSSHGFGPSRETFLFHEKHGIPWRVALE